MTAETTAFPGGLFLQHKLGEWHERAACKNADPALFDEAGLSEGAHNVLTRQRSALAYCARCPVRQECETEAREMQARNLAPTGIWGGFRFRDDDQYGNKRAPIDLLALLHDPAAHEAAARRQERLAQRRRVQRERQRARAEGRLDSGIPTIFEGRRVLPMQEACDLLNLKRRTVEEFLTAGTLESVKVMGRRLVFADSVERLVAQRRVSIA